MNSRQALEERLADLFERQAAALPAAAAPQEPPLPPFPTPSRVPARRRSRRRRAMAVAAVAAVSAVLVALVGLSSRGSDDAERRTTDRADAVDSRPVRAETNRVSFHADSVVIDAGETTFRTAEPIAVSGDPGTPEYTTLELEWFENGEEMRLYVFFTSDGREWWANEIQTYDGRPSERVDWITYTGPFFRTPLGQPFVGDLDITSSQGEVSGRLQLSGLRLEAFRPPAGCDASGAQFVVETDARRVEMVASPDSAFAFSVTVYDAPSCSPLPDDRFTYQWTADDPTLLNVTSDGARVELNASRPGQTALRLRVTDTTSGAAVGDAVVEVVARA